MYSYWSAGSQTLGCTKLLFYQLVVIWNVDVGFNNCRRSDMTIIRRNVIAMASSSDSGVPPSTFSQESTHEPVIYIDYVKFEEKEMGIIGTFWKHYRACLQALKKWFIGGKKKKRIIYLGLDNDPHANLAVPTSDHNNIIP